MLEHTKRPALKEFLSGRLRRLDLVGKPAPAIQGTDLEGKPFDLAELKGQKVALVVFWASWCVPCEAEVEWLREVETAYRARGLQIVGINLDALSAGDQKAGSVLPNVRRFLLDHDVSWPTLMNGQGEKDYAAAYGVSEIPANVLVGKDGTVAPHRPGPQEPRADDRPRDRSLRRPVWPGNRTSPAADSRLRLPREIRAPNSGGCRGLQ